MSIKKMLLAAVTAGVMASTVFAVELKPTGGSIVSPQAFNNACPIHDPDPRYEYKWVKGPDGCLYPVRVVAEM